MPSIYQPTAKLVSTTVSSLANPMVNSMAASARVGANGRPGIRPQILDAALAEFAEKGFEDASLASIARKIGVTAPLILYHFGSKANLWKDSVEILCARLGSLIESAVEDGRNMAGRTALRVLVRRLVFFFATNPAMHRLLRDDAVAAGAHAEWLSTQQLAPLFAQVESVYRRAVEEGALRSMPFDMALFMILGAASQYLEARKLVSKVYGRSDFGPEWQAAYVEQVLDFCFAGLASEPVWNVASMPLRIAVGG